MNRRTFIKNSVLLTGGVTFFPGLIMSSIKSGELKKITLLHTNDTHSRLDPFPLSDAKYPGLGGVYKRARLIEQIRSEEKNVLLFDCGDIFQGTPYFNFFGGEPELKAMSTMDYDAATLGNHDFDNGLEGLLKVMPNAKFPFICSNYDFSNTPLHKKTITHKVIKMDDVKIGVFGLGVELKGLVPSKLFGETQYLNPIEVANTYSKLLKIEEKCDLVICLSHLGYEYKEQKVSDRVIAQSCDNIDVILGGHTHTFLPEPVKIIRNNKSVLINQCGWGGIYLGKIDIYLEKKKNKLGNSTALHFFNEKNILV